MQISTKIWLSFEGTATTKIPFRNDPFVFTSQKVPYTYLFSEFGTVKWYQSNPFRASS